MATHDEVTAVVAYLSTHYPDWKPLKSALKAWCDVWAELPGDTLRLAAHQYVREHTFGPNNAAELYKLAKAPEMPALPSWTEAWEEAVQVYGGWSPGKPARQGVLWRNDLARQAAEQIGGWWAVIATEQPETARAHFRDAYNALASRARTEAAMTPEYRDLIAETRQRALRIVRAERTGTDDV